MLFITQAALLAIGQKPTQTDSLSLKEMQEREKRGTGSDPSSGPPALSEAGKLLNLSDLQHLHHRVMRASKERIHERHLI